MYAGGQSRDGKGGGGDGARDALLRRRRGKAGPSSSSSSSSTSTSGAVAEEEFGGRKQQSSGRRKRQQGKRDGAVARAFRDGLPAAAASCWRGVSADEEKAGGRSRRRDVAADGSGRDGDNGSREGGSGTATGKAAAAWCCVCPAGDCSLEPNPSASGKEDPGVRSLLERNDFFAADCNPHADGLGLPSSSSQ